MMVDFLCSHFHGFIVTFSNGHMEHMGETLRFLHLLRVVTVHGFINITAQIGLGNEMVGTEYHTLEMGPKAFNGVRGVSADDKLTFAVVDSHMGIF